MKNNGQFSQDIGKKIRQLMKSRVDKAGFWSYAAAIGGGGWLFVMPVIAGAYLGRYLDKKVPAGISWTLTFMLLGIAAGAYNIWYFYFRRSDK